MGSWGLLLAPGAGAGSEQPGLVAVDRAVTSAGGVVHRMDFPYRLAGRRAPDRPSVLLNAVEKEAAAFSTGAGIAPSRLFLGGRSMGGRICSLAVASGLPAAGLVLISYPLHSPGRPEALRTEHFGRLRVPCLFVSGTRDAFASTDELSLATREVTGPVTVRFIEGADHGLRRQVAEAAEIVATWLVAAAGEASSAAKSRPALSG